MRSSIACLVLCALAAGSLSAQRATAATPLLRGFWFGVDGGYGRLDLPNCIACEPSGAPFGALRLGGQLSSHALLGFGATFAGKSGELPATVVTTVDLYFYPMLRSGLHFRTGVAGIMRDGHQNVDPAGVFGVALGAGYDYRVGRNVSIVPAVSWTAGPGGYATNLLRAGIGITFH